jgi:hypothetical protein
MVSKWINPEPRPKQVIEPLPPYDPDAPSFAVMRRQLEPVRTTQSQKLVFRTHRNAEKNV